MRGGCGGRMWGRRCRNDVKEGYGIRKWRKEMVGGGEVK
jgi:hypothetical protein